MMDRFHTLYLFFFLVSIIPVLIHLALLCVHKLLFYVSIFSSVSVSPIEWMDSTLPCCWGRSPRVRRDSPGPGGGHGDQGKKAWMDPSDSSCFQWSLWGGGSAHRERSKHQRPWQGKELSRHTYIYWTIVLYSTWIVHLVCSYSTLVLILFFNACYFLLVW